MSRRVVLHVGAPKSGTTYLQSRLVRNAAALAQVGVTVPLATSDEGRGSLAFRAALDLTGRRMGRPRSYVEGYWPRLVEAVASAPGDVVISHEAFVRCDAEQAARAVTELGAAAGPDGEVHVVYTARDLARSLVSAWLEGLKHGTTHTLAEHLALAESGELPVLQGLELPTVLSTWVDVVPEGRVGRVHLVTVPPSGAARDLLWTRFCAAAALDPGAAPQAARVSNDAVGVPEAQLLLALNRLLGPAVARGGEHHRVVSRTVATALADAASPRVGLPPTALPWFTERAAAWVAWVGGAGVDVVGDLDDLRPVPPDPATYVDVAEPHPAVAEAAARALAAVLDSVLGSGPRR